MRRANKGLVLAAALLLIVAGGCLERKIHSEQTTHPAGWDDPGAAEFHGAEVTAQGPGGCAACHGADYRGGPSGVSCYACHGGEPRGALGGHPKDWMAPDSTAFHGVVVLQNGWADCSRCHGAVLGGGTSGLACGECHR
jgi:hypothetical protein